MAPRMTQQDKGRARKQRAEGKRFSEIAKIMTRSVESLEAAPLLPHLCPVTSGSAGLSNRKSRRPRSLSV